VQLLFASALEDQGLLGPDGLPPEREQDEPILVAWSDNGSEMTAIDTRQFTCAARRLVVSPAQPGVTRKEVTGSNGLPGSER